MAAGDDDWVRKAQEWARDLARPGGLGREAARWSYVDPRKPLGPTLPTLEEARAAVALPPGGLAGVARELQAGQRRFVAPEARPVVRNVGVNLGAPRPPVGAPPPELTRSVAPRPAAEFDRPEQAVGPEAAEPRPLERMIRERLGAAGAPRRPAPARTSAVTPEPPRVGAPIAPGRPQSTYERALRTVPGYGGRGADVEPLGSPEEEMQKAAGRVPLARSSTGPPRPITEGVPLEPEEWRRGMRVDDQGRPYIEQLTGGQVRRQYSGGEIAKPPSTGDPVLDDLNAHIERLNTFRSPPMSQEEGLRTYASLQKMMQDALDTKARYMAAKLKPQATSAEEQAAKAQLLREQAGLAREQAELAEKKTLLSPQMMSIRAAQALAQLPPDQAKNPAIIRSFGLPVSPTLQIQEKLGPNATFSQALASKLFDEATLQAAFPEEWQTVRANRERGLPDTAGFFGRARQSLGF